MNFYCDDKYVLKILNDNIKMILAFWNSEINNNIAVKVLNFKNFKNEFESYLNCPMSNDITGFIEDDRKTIVYLEYKDWKYTTHKNDKKSEYDKVIIHELVHMVNSIFCDCSYPSDDIWEGVAYFLAGQTNCSYYDSFAKLAEKIDHDELLRIINNN